MKSGGKSAIWRNVDTVGKELSKGIINGCDTLGKLWDEAARTRAGKHCMGTREVVSMHDERQADGRSFQKLVSEFIFIEVLVIFYCVHKFICRFSVTTSG